MHPVRKNELYSARTINRPRAAVRVRLERTGLVIVPGEISVLKNDAFVVPLPDRLRVVSEDGEVVKPSDGSIFLITTETMNPFHLVTQLPRDEW